MSLRGNQPATYDMLQKEIMNGFRKTARQNEKLLLKITVSNLRDIWSNTALSLDSYPKLKLKFKSSFLNIFDFIIPCFKALPKDG